MEKTPSEFFVREMPNGLVLLGQRMPQVESAAMALMVSAGAARDPGGSQGAASVLTEWLTRGAGDRDTRQFNDALDSLGCQHEQNVASEHIHFQAAQLGRNLDAVIELHADMLRRPMLAEKTFASCRDLVVQDLASLEDEPSHKCNVMLRERFYPPPLGRCVYGTDESLDGLAPLAVRGHFERNFVAGSAIMAVAGEFDWARLCDTVERCFGDWSGQSAPPVCAGEPAGGRLHVRKPSAQTHIALAHKAVPIADPRCYAARMAEMVLSGGMSSRLFHEVREKRGLAYTVSTRYHSLKDMAGLFTYAGTTPQRAQETLDVTVRELRRLPEGLDEAELQRARTQLKASLVMQGESTVARAASLASDWYHLRRTRSLLEISAAIDAVTVEAVREYWSEFPPEDFTALVIAPEPLDFASA